MKTFAEHLIIDCLSGGLDYRSRTVASLRGDGVPEGAILGAVQAVLKRRVDADAETLRARVMTSGSGQAMEYQEAASQAFAAIDAEPATVTAERFPMLAVSVGIDIDPATGAEAADVLGVARSVKRAYLQWQAFGSAIRGTRLAGKQAIDKAVSVEAAAVAFDAIVWPTLS